MRKIIGIAVALAVIATMLFGSTALAWGDENVNVELSEIDIDGKTQVGNEVTISGTVTIVSTAEARGFLCGAYAESGAWYEVSNPDNITVVSGSNSEADWDVGLFHADADTSQVYAWQTTINLNQAGIWAAGLGGEAFAAWGCLLGGGGSDEALNSFYITFAVRHRPEGKGYIQVWLPDAKSHFQRNGNRRFAPIDFNDGTWRFQLAPNVLAWSGEGGAATRIIVDENGQVVNDVWFQRGAPIITKM